MSAETLRQAAALMREQHGPDHQRHAMWAAMADWLDAMAARAEAKLAHGGNESAVWAHERHALAVARAYLGTTAALPPDHATDSAAEMKAANESLLRGGGVLP